MKTKIENVNACTRLINIELSREELEEKFDQVYVDIGKTARVPGFRPGHAPRDLLETYYSQKAQEEAVKRAISEYYLKAVQQEGLAVLTTPEIDNVQLKNHTLYFSAKVDVRPQVKLKGYKNLKIIRKKLKIEPSQIEQTLERLRQSKAKEVVKPDGKEKEKVLPTLDDAFAQDLGFSTLQDLKAAVDTNLQTQMQMEIEADMENQLMEQLLNKAALEIPESLINSETQEVLKQLKWNRILQGEKKEDVEAKENQWQDEARKEAVRRIKLAFILREIAQQENIQAQEGDLEKRIEAIAQNSAKSKDELRQYLESQNLLPHLLSELKTKKTVEFLLREAKIEEE